MTGPDSGQKISPGRRSLFPPKLYLEHSIKISFKETPARGPSRRQRIKAFSLVEVVLALGLAAFALTSILALMSVGLDSSKASSDDTVLAIMSVATVNDLRRQPFSDLPGSTDLPSPGTPVEKTYPIFFDVSGGRIKNAAGQDISESDIPNYPNAVYRCSLSLLGDPDTLSPVSGNPSLQSVNLLRVRLTFQWPLKATVPNSRVIHATIARY